MNRVAVNAEEVPLPSWSNLMSGYALKVLQEINRDNWELSILLCGNKTITELNSQYRNMAEATDVLSFNLGTEVQDGDKSVYFPGDIVISLETLSENARYYQTTEDEELRRLLIHGILHLDGMEHSGLLPEDRTEKTDPMLVLQEEILDRLNNERIIPGGKD